MWIDGRLEAKDLALYIVFQCIGAIIGIALGIGFYSGAFLAMLACVFTAAVLTRIEHKRKKTMRIYIEVNMLDLLEEICAHLKVLLPADASIEVIAPKSATAGNMGIDVISARVADTETLKTQIKAHGGVHFIVVE